MDETKMISVLLSWTIHLSGYPNPATPPEIEYQPHSFFVEHACLGKEQCRVAGWYDNNGIIYLDEQLKGQDDAITRSLIVHELVHYLQDLSGKFSSGNCNDHLVREREAYSVQRQYLNRIAGRFIAIYMNYPPCPDP
jgi:hypothetical protein